MRTTYSTFYVTCGGWDLISSKVIAKENKTVVRVPGKTRKELIAENEKLTRQIRTLVMNPDSASAAMIRVVTRNEVNAEKAYYAGDTMHIPKRFQGLIHYTKIEE